MADEGVTPKLATPSLRFGKTLVAHEGVTLKWEIDAFAASDESPARVVRFGVERKPTASDTWTTLSDSLPRRDRSFTDAGFKPGTRYVYRLTCYFTHAGAAPPPDPVRIGMTSVVTAPVETLSIWNLTINTAMRGQAYLTIEKFDRKLGRKVEKKHIHHAGEQIGWWKETGGDGPVSTHLVSLGGGKSAPVDFNTGMTLVSVGKKPATIQIDKCRAIFGAGGKRVGCKQSKLTVTISNTYEIVTVDDAGTHVLFYPDPTKNPRAVSQACKNHGGVKDFRRPIESDESLKLLSEADRLWRSDPEKAILIYKRLLAEFGNTEWVRMSRTRIRLRAEQGD